MKPPQSIDRRAFLGRGLGALSGAALAPAWLCGAARALSAGERRLVVVELFGGNDGLNTLVPYQDDLYHRARPLIGLGSGAYTPLDELNGLHTALARTHARYDQGQVAIVRGVGYPQPSLSHFQSRDIWSCATTEGLPAATGWLGRGAEALHLDDLGLLAIGSDRTPRLVRGPHSSGLAVPELWRFRFDSDAELDPREAQARRAAFDALAQSRRGADETGFVADGLRRARRTSHVLARAGRTQRGVDYPGGSLARNLASTADLIASGLPTRLFHVQLDGFDTHTRQVAEQARLLRELDGALDAFLRDLALQGRLADTLVLVISEFGRRLAESGVGSEAGSDHGAASVSLLLGGCERGGLYGTQPDLEHIDEAGNPVYTVDFRSVLQSTLTDGLALDSRALLDGTWPRLELVQPA